MNEELAREIAALRQEFNDRLDGLLLQHEQGKINYTHTEVYYRPDHKSWIARCKGHYGYKHILQTTEKSKAIDAAETIDGWITFVLESQ